MNQRDNLHNEALAVRMLLRVMRQTEQIESEDEDVQIIIDDDLEIIIDSETNFTEALEGIIASIIVDEAHVHGLAGAIKNFKARAERKAARIERRKGAILAALEIAGLTKKELATATVSVSAGRPKVIVTDEAAIPDDLVRTHMWRDPDLTKIAAQLKAGEDVPGAILSNTKPTLRVLLK